MEELFDVVIIGGGPAGVCAAIYAVRKSLKVLLISKDIGGQAARSGEIENYPGFSMISGVELAQKFRDDLAKYEKDQLKVIEGVEVIKLEKVTDNFNIYTDTAVYHAKTIIIATGRVPRKLDIPGEDKFIGRGVAYCATCDAPFYKDKKVVVIGGGNSALDATIALSKQASEVIIVNIMDQLKGDAELLKSISRASNVKIMNNQNSLEIIGGMRVSGLVIQDQITFKKTTIPTDGVFIEVGYQPSADKFDQLTDKDERGLIKVDEFGKTSVDGIWAAGDVNNLWGEQIVIAAGEGAKVALAVSEYIAKIPHAETSNPHQQA